MTTIRVLDTGCPKCQQAAQDAAAAARVLGLETEPVKVNEPAGTAEFGVTFTPARAIDGQVRVSGGVLSADEIKAWLKA